MNNYPQDDEYSIQQGDFGGSANLDIFYPHQFIQNEEIVNAKMGVTCTYSFGYDNILKSCTTASVYYDDFLVCTFFDKDGELVFQEVVNELCLPKIVSGKIDYELDLISLTWDKKIPAGKSKVVTSFEYNLECQFESLECPKCNHKFCKLYKCNDDALTLRKLASGDGFLDIY